MSIEALKRLEPKRGNRERLERRDEEIVEAIRALRRGVPLKAVSQVFGFSDNRGSGVALRGIIGTWAIRHAVLPEDEAKVGA